MYPNFGERTKEMIDYWDGIFKRDTQLKNPRGWIQWKGTDVCIDLHCDCGFEGHIDAGFFYHYECPSCKTKYAVGQNIKLIKLTTEEIEHGEKEGFTYETDDLTMEKEWEILLMEKEK